MSLTEFERRYLLDVRSSLQESVDRTALDLFSVRIGVEGMKILSPVLTNLTSLTYLNLSYNDLGVEAISILTPALSCFTSLTSLDLCGNKFGVEGMKKLAPVLLHLVSLTHLYIYGNEFGDEGMKILCNALYYHPSIYSYSSSVPMEPVMNRNKNNVIQRRATLFELIWNDQKLKPDYSYQYWSTGVKENKKKRSN